LDEAIEAGVPAVILFGLPNDKAPHGENAMNSDGIFPRAIRAAKAHAPDLVVISDVCFCAFTEHGHCGVWEDGALNNDATLSNLGEQAVAHAMAGVDMVAPSDMTDGKIAAIRSALDEAGFVDLPIMSYATKFASAYYGPFREAAGNKPGEGGHRKSYQMDPANLDEAIHEALLDLDEGADILMVKPALAFLDVVRLLKDQVPVPVAVYSVSGEYAMIEAAAANGWIDRDAVLMETLTSMKRAGADLILTYHAVVAAQLIRGQH
jgi:porphobilinogen synthase